MPSTSESLLSTGTVTVPEGGTRATSFTATGASLTPVTTTVTVAGTENAVPSVARYVNVSLSVAAGRQGLQLRGAPRIVREAAVGQQRDRRTELARQAGRFDLDGSPSASVSPTSSPGAATCQQGCLPTRRTASLSATGASFTPVTVTVTVAELVAPAASRIVYVNVSCSDWPGLSACNVAERRRVVHEVALAPDHHRRASGAHRVGADDHPCVARVLVGVIAQHARRVDGQHAVLAGGVRVVDGHRCVIHAADSDRRPSPGWMSRCRP